MAEGWHFQSQLFCAFPAHNLNFTRKPLQRSLSPSHLRGWKYSKHERKNSASVLVSYTHNVDAELMTSRLRLVSCKHPMLYPGFRWVSLFCIFQEGSSHMTVGLAGEHQIQNATIAVELSRRFLQERQALEDASELPSSFVAGLKAAKWPGRCQTVADPINGNLTWYLDGAHTIESLDCCMDWFLNPGVGVDSEGNLYVLPELSFREF